jgi:suppressor of ftsI
VTRMIRRGHCLTCKPPDPPQVVSPFELRAINDPATGKGAFVFEGHEVPPVVRAVPGGTIQLEYINQMSTHSREVCVDGPCMNMTNLHFHGLQCFARCSWG